MGAFFVIHIQNSIIFVPIMRLVKEVPHSHFKIQIHQYNGKYIVKIELGQFEQTFKIGATDVSGLEELENMITTDLQTNTIKRFIEMRSDWEEAFTKKNTK